MKRSDFDLSQTKQITEKHIFNIWLVGKRDHCNFGAKITGAELGVSKTIPQCLPFSKGQR